MHIIASNEPIEFDISPIPGKKDMYRGVYSESVPSATLLTIYNYAAFKHGIGIIALGDIESSLVNVFSDMSQPAYAALPELEGVVNKYPNNEKLNTLLIEWQKVASAEKDNSDYTYAQKAWEEYEGTTKLTLQQRYLEKVLREINGYLNAHPNGVNAEEATNRKTMADERLKEIVKMLYPVNLMMCKSL